MSFVLLLMWCGSKTSEGGWTHSCWVQATETQVLFQLAEAQQECTWEQSSALQFIHFSYCFYLESGFFFNKWQVNGIDQVGVTALFLSLTVIISHSSKECRVLYQE